MAITYRWEIIRLQVQPSSNGRENVLYRVHWKLWGKIVDETGEYESSIEDVTTLRFNPNDGFLSFEELIQNHSLIIRWVEARENERVRNMDWRKQQLNKLLIEKKTPTIIDYNSNGEQIKKPY